MVIENYSSECLNGNLPAVSTIFDLCECFDYEMQLVACVYYKPVYVSHNMKLNEGILYASSFLNHICTILSRSLTDEEFQYYMCYLLIVKTRGIDLKELIQYTIGILLMVPTDIPLYIMWYFSLRTVCHACLADDLQDQFKDLLKLYFQHRNQANLIIEAYRPILNQET